MKKNLIRRSGSLVTFGDPGRDAQKARNWLRRKARRVFGFRRDWDTAARKWIG